MAHEAANSHAAGPQKPADVLLQHYRMGKTVGVGSFGKVKVAEHLLTGQKVAIKILNRKKIQSMDMEEKVRREIKIASLFQHPHIIRLYEVIKTPVDIYVVMEYVKSGELFDYIVEKGRLPEEEARHFFQQIISGLECCHRNMVVHRDLKPENLLLDARHHVKLADFGLSNVMRDGHFLKTSCGSPNYAAPEVISGKLYAGPEVDVWSCGVILYALLCGSLPFDDENIPNLFKKIKQGSYSFPNYLTPGARDLIRRMLIVQPLERITIPEIRQHPWFSVNLPRYLAVMQAEPVSAVRIDKEALQQCSNWGFDQHALVTALKTRQSTRATVAYHLVVDNRSTDNHNDYLQMELGEASAARLQHPSGIMGSLGGEGPGQPTSQAQRFVAERSWRLGVRTNKRPPHICQDLLNAFRELGVAWKHSGPYNYKCRVNLYASRQNEKVIDAMDVDNGNSDASPRLAGKIVKFEVQIYRLKTHQYVIDVQRLEGHLYLYLDLTSDLLSIMRAQAARGPQFQGA